MDYEIIEYSLNLIRCIDPVVVPLIVSSALAAGGALTNYFSTKSQNKANVDLWKQQMDYNTPTNQMARFAAAGLNPRLMYTQGDAGTAGPPPKMENPTTRAYQQTAASTEAMMQYALQMRLQGAQIQNLESQNKVIEQQAITETIKQAGMLVGTETERFNLGLARKLENNSIQVAIANLEKLSADIERSKAETNLTNANIGRTLADTERIKVDKILTEANIRRTEAERERIYANIAQIRQDIEYTELKKDLTFVQTNQLEVAIAKLQEDFDFTQFENMLKKAGIYPTANWLTQLTNLLVFRQMPVKVKEEFQKRYGIEH